MHSYVANLSSTTTKLATFVLLLGAMLGPQSSFAKAPFVVVLGTAQDGGYPQIDCRKSCCQPAWEDFQRRRFVSCLAIVDPDSGERWLLDCTPDFRDQLQLLNQLAPRQADQPLLNGIFPTHAHVGHYTGLMLLGREVIGAQGVVVHSMPRMKYFLETNGPWSQLVELGQIQIKRLAAGQPCILNERISLTPFLVPHRDEFSETVGFEVHGPSRSLVYLPDIDKWSQWEVPIEELVSRVDVAFLDGTFFDEAELPGRDMSEIPHPFVIESLARFEKLPASDRSKIHFIHMNHSNPLLQSKKATLDQVRQAGCSVAAQWRPGSQQSLFPL